MLQTLAVLLLALFSVRPEAHPLPDVAPPPAAPETETTALVPVIAARTEGLAPEVLRLALDATACANKAGLVTNPGILTVIDYSRPSVQPRLWVIDLESRAVLFHERVAHGKNSGHDRTVSFSNVIGSLQTSLGLFVTGESYAGQNGYSLRLDGLEPGFNDRARERAIVVHGAPYVNDGVIRSLGRLGRSWGCPAVRSSAARPLIDTIKGGSAVFAYYPDAAWLNGSQVVGRCGA
jgi:hypothetical protein